MLTVADPLSKQLELAETVRLSQIRRNCHGLQGGFVKWNRTAAFSIASVTTKESMAFQNSIAKIVLGALAELEGATDPLLPSAGTAAWQCLNCAGHAISLAQVRQELALE